MAKLEAIEWTNMWLDLPEDKNKKRVLLIGDTITQGMKSFVKQTVGENILVDAITTSRATDNPAFETEIFYILNNAEYDIIHFNNGLHGFHQSVSVYEEKYSIIIGKIIEKFPGTKIILGLSTPVTVSGNPESFDSFKNKIVIERNEAVERIAEKYGLEVSDNYSAVAGKTEICTGDGYHYNEDGYKILGDKVGKLLK